MKTTQTPATDENKKGLQIRVSFSTNFWLRLPESTAALRIRGHLCFSMMLSCPGGALLGVWLERFCLESPSETVFEFEELISWRNKPLQSRSSSAREYLAPWPIEAGNQNFGALSIWKTEAWVNLIWNDSDNKMDTSFCTILYIFPFHCVQLFDPFLTTRLVLYLLDFVHPFSTFTIKRLSLKYVSQPYNLKTVIQLEHPTVHFGLVTASLLVTVLCNWRQIVFHRLSGMLG